jgi:hypothetical protein
MNNISLIMGMHEETKQIYFWNKTETFTIGDYAIVESNKVNKLIRIIGDVLTTKEFCKTITRNNFKNVKEIKMIIPKNKLEKGDDNYE